MNYMHSVFASFEAKKKKSHSKMPVRCWGGNNKVTRVYLLEVFVFDSRKRFFFFFSCALFVPL